MENINQKGCIKVNFAEGLGIFDRHYMYPQIDSQESYNGPTGKVKDIQGIQAHAGHNSFVPVGNEFSFDIDECPYLHIAIKAEKGTSTCLVLCVSDKEPREHIRRHVVIGITPKGDFRFCNLIKDCFKIKDDGEWHEYTFDLRKIREIQDNDYPYYPDAVSVCKIQFYSWTGSEDHTFYFNDLSAVAAPNFIVHGKVYNTDGTPKSGLTVKAFDRNVGVDDSYLGEYVTDNTGNYFISYNSSKLKGKLSADLVLNVYKDDKMIQEADVIFNAKPDEVKDFTVAVDDVTEFHHLSNKIKPLLHNNILLSELSKNHISFLSKKTGIEVRQVERLAEAKRLSNDDEILAIFYYGLLSQNFPTDPSALLRRDRASINIALKRAESLRLIPSLKPQNIDSILDYELPRLRAESILISAEPGQQASLGDLLQTMPKSLPDSHKIKVADIVSQNGIKYDKLQDQLRSAGFEPAQAIGVERTLRLGDLTLRNLPLMQHLHGIIGEDQDASLKYLTKFGSDQWIDIAYTYGVTPGSNLTPDAYAKQMEMSLDELYPTEMLAARINNGDLVITQPGFENVRVFLDNNPDFDIIKTNLPVYAAKANFKGVENKDQLVKSLLKLQRIKRFSASWNEAGIILNAGLESIIDVVGAGRTRIIDILAEGKVAPERASCIYERAQKVHDVSLVLMSGLLPRFSPTPVVAMGDATRQQLNTSRTYDLNISDSNYATLQSLFESLDNPLCDFNQSVLSPAAYFVDLLQFLNTKMEEPTTNPLLALLQRRPDLVDLKFSYNNTETELPYIDIVLEILENAVALPHRVNLPNVDVNAAFVEDPLTSPITDALQSTSLRVVGSNLKAFEESRAQRQLTNDWGNLWIVDDGQRRWTLYGQNTDVMNVKIPGQSVLKIPFYKQNVDLLEKGTLSDDIKNQIESLLREKTNARFLSIVDYSVSAIIPRGKWQVNCWLGADIIVTNNDNDSTLTIKSPSDQVVFQRTYSLASGTAMVNGLKSGTISGPLQSLIAQLSSLKIDVAKPNGSYSISIPPIKIIITAQDTAYLAIMALSYQTVGKSEDLIACPENQNPLAYQILRNPKAHGKAFFPWSLPFNLPWESVRACLDRAGVSRRKLMELTNPEKYLEDVSIAQEVLGISNDEAALIVKNEKPKLLWQLFWQYWGLINPYVNLSGWGIFDAEDGKMRFSEKPMNLLSIVSVLTQQARISYEDMLSILHTKFVSSPCPSTLPIMPLDEYRLNYMHIDQLRPIHLDRMHRFIRLWKRFGWAIADLDLALNLFQFWKGANGTIITWSSSDTSIISNSGEVFRPDSSQRPAIVSLTATISKGSVKPETKIFEDLIVAPLPKSDFDAVKADETDIYKCFKDGGSAFAPEEKNSKLITLDLNLPFIGANGSTIIWYSSNSRVINSSGQVTRPAHGEGNSSIELVASLIKGSQVIDTKPIFLTVSQMPSSDSEAANLDANNYLSKCFEPHGSAYSLGDNSSSVTRDLLLPSQGPNGSVIIWHSSNEDIITTDGTINRPDFAKGNATVYLTADIIKGDVVSNKEFSLTVISLVQNDKQAVQTDASNCSIGIEPLDRFTIITRNLNLIEFSNFSETLKCLSHIQRLQELLSLDINILLSWWGGGSTLLYRPYTPSGQEAVISLYEQIFLNPVVQDRPDSAFLLNPERTALLNSGYLLSDKSQIISAALGISQNDFKQLLINSRVEDKLTLDNLFELNRISGLARVLELSITDYFSVLSFTNIQPFSSTTKLIEFCKTIQFIQNSGFTIEELSYLLLNEKPSGSGVVMNDNQVSQILKNIRSAMQTKLNVIDQQVRDLIKKNPGGVTIKNPDVAADKASLTIGFKNGDNESSITGNLTLPPSGVKGSRIIWISSDPRVISDSSIVNKVIGTVAQPSFAAGDADVTLTAIVTKDTSSDTKDFKLKVVKLPQTDAEAVAADKEDLTIGFIASDSASRVADQISLPITIRANGSNIKWMSSNSSVIDANGTVNRPDFLEGDVSLTLTAIIAKGIYSDTKEFYLTVIKKSPTDSQAVAADKLNLNIGFISSLDNAKRITGNLIMATTGIYGSKITWNSSDPRVISDSSILNTYIGTVARPSFNESDANISLKATITMGSIVDYKEFDNLIVKKQPKTDAESVSDDKAALTIGFDSPNDSASSVTGNYLILPTSVPAGSTITWYSSNSNVVSPSNVNNKVNGIITRPAFPIGDVIVTLKAIITKGISSDTKDFQLNVIKLPQTDAEALAADKQTLTIGFATGDSATRVTGDLKLSLIGSNGSNIRWTSSNPSVINTDGKVNRPYYNTGDETHIAVTLTAIINKSTAQGILQDSQDFNLTVMKLTDVDAVALDKAALTIGFTIASDTFSSVTGKLTLPTNGTFGSLIKWHSSDPNLVNPENGEVSRPDLNKNDICIALIATITKGVTSDIKIFYPQDLLNKPILDENMLTNVFFYPDFFNQLIDVILGSVAELFSLELPVARKILVTDKKQKALLKHPLDVNKDGIEVIFDPLFAGSDADTEPDCNTFIDAYTLVYRLHKTAILLSKLNIKPMEVAWFDDQASDMKILDFNYLLPETFLFNWDNPSENNLVRLINVLKENLSIDWLRKEDIKYDKNTISFSNGINDLSLILSNDKVIVNLTSTDTNTGTSNTSPEIYEFNDRMENGSLTIYLKTISVSERFMGWQQFVTLFQIRDRITGMRSLLDLYVAELIKQQSLGSLNSLSVLAALIGTSLGLPKQWDYSKITTQLGINVIDDYRNPLRLEELINLLVAMKKLGATIEDVNLLTQVWPEPDILSSERDPATQAEITARTLLRGKYRDDSWNSIVKPISNTLRIKQRDALVDYLIHTLSNTGNGMQIRDTNTLYEYLLIDTQMSSCMLTSRLVQATASVQLFVQRCLLNLETAHSSYSGQQIAVQLDVDHRKQWEWMKNYRLWEANREVFLFPENWLFPELRDDKTETFKALESGINQGEPKDQLAKDNVLKYLDELNEIAKITVYGMYEDIDDSGNLTLYVVGRTPDQPYNYYWRQCNAFGDAVNMRWSGWEKLIENGDDHIMPFVMEHDLHIAWPTITLKKDTTDSDPKNHYDYWEIKLNWIRHTKNGWTKKKVSKDIIPFPSIHDSKIVDNHNLLKVNTDFKDPDKEITFRIQTNPTNFSHDKLESINFLVYNNQEHWPPEDVCNYTTEDPSKQPPNVIATGSYKRMHEDYINKQLNWYPAKFTIYPYEILYKSPDLINPYHYESTAYIRYVTFRFIYSGFDEKNKRTCPTGSFDVTVPLNYVTDNKDPNYGNARFQYTLHWDYFEREAAYLDSSIIPFLKAVLVLYNGKQITKYINNYSYDFNVVIYSFEQTLILDDHPKILTPTWELVYVGKFVLNSFGDIKVYPPGSNNTTPLIDASQCYANGYIAPENQNGLQLNIEGTDVITIANIKSSGLVIPSAPQVAPNNKSVSYFEYPPTIALPINTQSESSFKLFIYNEPDSLQSVNSYLEIFDRIKVTASLRSIACQKTFDDLYLPLNQKSLQVQNFVLNNWSEGAKFQNLDPTGFAMQAPFSLYNWELLYHVPMLIAEFLSKQQRFEDAQKWLHYIFNPTNPDDTLDYNGKPISIAAQFWRFLPFRHIAAGDVLQQLFEMLSEAAAQGVDPTDTNKKSELAQFKGLINEWRNKPFLPFLIARTPIRWVSFQWRTVFAYLDNLIAWGDQMFRRFTRESVNEAILYYIMASKLLGPRPKSIKTQLQPSTKSYRDFYNYLDDFSNAWYVFSDNPLIRNLTEVNCIFKPNPSQQFTPQTIITSVGMLYFGIPANDKLLGYWDKIEQRLLNIRNCQDIDGVAHELSLFAPKIDPLLLVRATAAGLDIATVLADMDAPLLPCRFNVIVQKANEICAEVKSLGTALLAALEKTDAEGLALLRSSQEVSMLNLVTQVKQRQIDEANANIDSLKQSMAVAMVRLTQYQKLLGKAVSIDSSGLPVISADSSLQVSASAPGEEAGLGLIQYEVDQLSSLDSAHEYQQEAGITSTIAGALHAIPESQTGGMFAYLHIGGTHLGNAANALASVLNILSSNASYEANKKGMLAQYQRRQDEWIHQSKLALEEIKQINKQTIAAQIRQDLAQKEMDNHLKQIENAQAVDDFMHDKYTNQELYSWMSGQISNVYFSCYQLAYDMAKRVEKAFQSELCLEVSNFIQFGYWDSLKKGLLSGENLSLDLKRMEMAYLEKNQRELEITKHVSLLQLDPYALLKLKTIGYCEVTIPEWLYDMDCPGHYIRRIKTVSLTIPCVTGPYTSVNCTLSLLKSSIRRSPLLKNNKYERIDRDDDRFKDYYSNIQSVVTSNAQNDSGLFETNLRDERYLPFEMAGAVSQWRLELSSGVRQFDYDTISDVILHIRYTARDGGDLLKSGAIKNLKILTDNAQIMGSVRLFSVRHEFPSEWAKFKNATIDSNNSISTAKLSLTLLPRHYPLWAQDTVRSGKVKINAVELFAEMLPTDKNDSINLYDCADSSMVNTKSDTLNHDPSYGSLLYGILDKIGKPAAITKSSKPWTLYFDDNNMEELWIAVAWGKA